MFRPVSSKVDWLAMEEGVLDLWREQFTFRQSLAQREGAPRFVFYEGPPTANGLPHVGHVETRAIKDLIPRYRTMKGYYVLRKAGWDTHGLPVEIEVEKELGFAGKRAIEEYGVARFNARCRESVFRYVDEWRRLTERIGFWIDLDDPYVTMDNSYIESVWWILKQLWEKGLLYQGHRVVPYCPRCGTALSDHEVAQGYEEAEDPSAYVRFRLRDRPGTSFLVWTTTPWTLPANVALAVHPDALYALVEQDGERLIVAEALVEQALHGEYRLVETMFGRELLGLRYEPLFRFLPVEQEYAYVVAGDFVTTKEGTGIVHIAPAFGGDDLAVGEKHNLPVLLTVDPEGRFVDAVEPWRGMFVKDADPLIVTELGRRGLLYHLGRYAHTYPFCWRCHAPLLYYAKTTWLVRTTAIREQLVATNQEISWYPEYIRDGRFGNWLANNVDWALGRERFWGTPLPIWRCEACDQQQVVGSVAELEERSGRDLGSLDLHRPFVDEVVYRCRCGGEMRRVPEVIDTWFDSGSMPYAQWHYPFANQELFADQYPADFISEAVDQTRGWFYTLHAISNLLFGRSCYRNCLVLGLVLDAEGRKMSKSLGNVIDPWEVLNVYGADAMRWYLYTAAAPWAEKRFSVELVGESYRKFLLTLWNTYAFFVTYANIDGYRPGGEAVPAHERPLLDRWMLSELNELVAAVDSGLEGFDVTGSARRIGELVDELSNWYVRRSRRRFWKSEQDADKAAAYATLYECLVTLASLLAPFTPFVSEAIYQNLVCSVDRQAPASVHLGSYPVADPGLIDRQLMADMRLAMRLVSLGHAARNKAGIKLRQPLADALIRLRNPGERAAVERLVDLVADELNVKAVRLVAEDSALATYEVRPEPRLLGSRYGPLFPRIRAEARARSAELGPRLRAGEAVVLTVDGQEIGLRPEEVEVRLVGRQGYSLAEEGGYVVAVSTTVGDALRREGLAREVVRRIQVMRKEADLRLEAPIEAYFVADAELSRVLQEWAGYIGEETLSRRLVEGRPPANAHVERQRVDGHAITLGIVEAPEAAS